jgi:hypothetical protein
MRTQLFVSYSHRDGKWLERLQVHLKPLVREGLVSVAWDDTKIQPGHDWRAEISTAIDTAAVAVLLVSADFLASDFIDKDELPPLLKAAEDGGLRVLPIIVSPSRFARTGLSRFQAVNDPARPLTALTESEQEAVFDTVARSIEAMQLRTALRDTRQRLVETERSVAKLFLLTMSGPMYDNLKKMAAQAGFGLYTMSPGLRRELYHLRDIGYIDVVSIKAIPDRGPNLSDHVRITEIGRQFVDLREHISAGEPV